jgi:hypothetical protein
MNIHHGGCHCGNIRLTFATMIEPGQTEIRACQCSFCVKHGSRAAADPQGKLTISVEDTARLQKYAFGLRTAEYLICRDCGVYVAALTLGDSDRRAIVIVNALDERELFNREPVAVDYSAESKDERLTRRRARWTPVEME